MKGGSTVSQVAQDRRSRPIKVFHHRWKYRLGRGPLGSSFDPPVRQWLGLRLDRLLLENGANLSNTQLALRATKGAGEPNPAKPRRQRRRLFGHDLTRQASGQHTPDDLFQCHWSGRKNLLSSERNTLKGVCLVKQSPHMIIPSSPLRHPPDAAPLMLVQGGSWTSSCTDLPAPYDRCQLDAQAATQA